MGERRHEKFWKQAIWVDIAAVEEGVDHGFVADAEVLVVLLDI